LAFIHSSPRVLGSTLRHSKMAHNIGIVNKVFDDFRKNSSLKTAP
jgi:hypothetical protein